MASSQNPRGTRKVPRLSFRALALVLLAEAAHAGPILKPADVAAALDKAMVDAKGAIGAAIEVGQISAADEVTIEAVRAAIAKLPVTLEVAADDGDTVITVQAKSGARAWIRLGPKGGAMQLTARPAQTKPPGACIAIPKTTHRVKEHATSVDQRGQRRSSETTITYAPRRMLDVDGDGILDVFVPAPQHPDACFERVEWQIYVVRGACGHEVGRVGPGDLSFEPYKVPLAASGFRPITTKQERTGSTPRSSIEMSTSIRTFEFANGQYGQTNNAYSVMECHHCTHRTCTKL